MNGINNFNKIIDLELHQVDRRFQGLRMRNLTALNLLTRSLEEAGQLVPVLVIPAEQVGMWILIDGYMRVEALKRLEREVVQAEVFHGSEEEALMVHLAHGQARTWEVIEEAAMIRELHDRFDCSLRLLAARVGRSASWVSRRISLIRELPEEVLERVLQGRLSVWAATRILLPLARANSDHAKSLLKYIESNVLSTRQLQSLWHHYQQSGEVVRQQLMAAPDLFFKSMHALEMERENPHLEESLEETWEKEARIIRHILERLLRLTPRIFVPGLPDALLLNLRRPIQRLDGLLSQLNLQIQECSSHAQSGPAPDHSDITPTGDPSAGDLPHPENFPQHGSESSASGRRKKRHAAVLPNVSTHSSPPAGFIPQVQG
ncbi:MAG: chromosome partitioning protein ParB [Magnetococcales bacterium]|nr:chromosome partitioning protein ParB [Magnetococcales bacterium]